MMNIVLASGSPRRIEMMRAHGIEPLVMPADIEENIPKVHGMCETVMFLALKKVQDVAGRLSSLADCTEEGSIIVAADTIVYKDGEIMGKPADRADAFRMLDKLRNDFHYVVTGVALLSYGRQLTRVFAEVTKVIRTVSLKLTLTPMKPMTRLEHTPSRDILQSI